MSEQLTTTHGTLKTAHHKRTKEEREKKTYQKQTTSLN